MLYDNQLCQGVRVSSEHSVVVTNHPSLAMPSTSKMIVLKSSDGVIFEVEEAVALKSQTIKNMIEGGDSSSIPLLNVTSEILAKVIEYCECHVEAAKFSEGEKLIDNKVLMEREIFDYLDDLVIHEIFNRSEVGYVRARFLLYSSRGLNYIWWMYLNPVDELNFSVVSASIHGPWELLRYPDGNWLGYEPLVLRNQERRNQLYYLQEMSFGDPNIIWLPIWSPLNLFFIINSYGNGYSIHYNLQSFLP